MPFAQIVGHTRALDLLRRAVSRRSVPQSLLFAGPEGVGKRTAAIALAQAVNCPQPTVDGDACGACNTCRRILAGTFSDVVTLDKGDKASIGIDPLRDQVLGPIAYRPFEGRHRVFIIDPATVQTHQMVMVLALVQLVHGFSTLKVAAAHAKSDSEIFIKVRDKQLKAVVTKLPFIKA